MAREPRHAALAADLERLGHDAAAVAAGTYSKADGQESAVSQRPDTPCVSWSPQNAPFFTVSRRHRSKGIGGEFIEGPFQWPSNMHTRSREQHGRRGSVSKGPSINVLCQKVQTIETVKVDTDWCIYKPAENAHVRFRMPRAFRSRQFLIDLLLGPLCSVGDLCAFWGPGRTHLCAVGKPVCGFWGLEERTGAFVRAFLGTWKKALLGPLCNVEADLCAF